MAGTTQFIRAPAGPGAALSSQVSFVTDEAVIAMAGKWLMHNLRAGTSISVRKVMNISSKNRILAICAYLGPVVCGLTGFAAPIRAQNAAAPAVSQSDSITASAQQPGAASGAEEGVR